MIACEIEKVADFGSYVLKSGAKRFKVVLEFYGVTKPKVNDKILINERLLDINWEGYTQPYAFGLIGKVTPKQVMSANNPEYIVLGTAGKNFVLKRMYG